MAAMSRFPLLGGQKHRRFTVVLDIIRERLHSPGRGILSVPQLDCAVQAGGYGSHISIYGSRSASTHKTVTPPLQVVITRDLLQLEIGELVFVHHGRQWLIGGRSSWLGEWGFRVVPARHDDRG